MNKKKIIFFGLGSIGRRHLEIIKENYEYDIYAYRTTSSDSIADVKNLYNLNDAFNINPDIAFITNPSSLHIETALLCLKAGIKNLFIEKPLSNNLEDLDRLVNLAEKKDAIIYIGYLMRHNPVLKRLKDLITDKLEEIFYVETICKSYLPDWRPGKDYRKVYSASKEMGGGVILDISHEFDYNQYLFGPIKSIKGHYGKISNLEINSEDYCEVTLYFNRYIIGRIHLDYFSYFPERHVKIICPNTEIKADLIKNEIKIFYRTEKRCEKFDFNLNDVYHSQMNYFLEGIENQSKKINNLEEVKELTEKLIEFKENNSTFFF